VAELAAWNAAPVSVFLASIGALDTTAPAGSAIVPVMVPRSDWANPITASNNPQMETLRKLMLISFHPCMQLRKFYAIWRRWESRVK
jgi:hypothetical protein